MVSTDREENLKLYKSKYAIVDMNRYDWTRLNAPKGKRIVDIGSCYGAMFVDYDKKLVTSVDLNDYSHVLENFVIANANNLPFKDGEFEIAVLTEILEHQNTWEESCKVLYEACRVASKVVLTVPNEYLWKDDAPDRFKKWEDVLKEENYNLLEKAFKEAPYAKNWNTGKGNFDHIFHHHQFTPEDIERMIQFVTDREYYIFILPNDGATEKAIGTTGAIIV